ncbi:unnamed protein product [Ciceribacter selenitireducens ATCC BAA-1503]|uniref:Uncharacterized protein n=1 Tax=Ciceribacter selenitireducens ATCC BAA-1503 TaxID=1336235 RepID=A0A376AKZ9_9HYPH|nr:unnamed protein product [Ciceribacter selenitireducens ATCC BAA-1503]
MNLAPLVRPNQFFDYYWSIVEEDLDSDFGPSRYRAIFKDDDYAICRLVPDFPQLFSDEPIGH